MRAIVSVIIIEEVLSYWCECYFAGQQL